MRRTKAEAEQTRENILEAAIDVFFENGVSHSTLEQIATRAGVTRGAIYWHFKDKVEIFKALQDSIRLPQEDLIAHAAEHGHDDPLALIESGFLAGLRLFEEDERQQRIVAILLQRCEYVGEMAAVARIGEANQRMLNHIRRLIQMASSKGSLRPDWQPETAAHALHCTMTGLIHEWLRSDCVFSLTEVGEKLIRELMCSFRQSGPSQPPC